MSSHLEITAVLVAYNSQAVIARSLEALSREPAVKAITVVDNCSRDDTCELVREQFPSVKLIENPKNDGFGRANNIGLNRVATPYALLVNPDAVLQPGALEQLLGAAQAYPDAAILAPALVDEEGASHHSFKRSVFAREESRDEYIEPEGDACAEFLSGAVWLLNMKLMKTVGFFDPAIFLYYEDDDLCLRARQAGYGLVYVPQAKAMHLMGKSSGEIKPESEYFKQKHMIWSRLYIERKYRGDKAAAKLATKLRAEYALKAALSCLVCNRRKINRYRGRLEGIFEFTAPAGTRKAA
jgi:N-acetylglucosaminyl-diphospho-decaprenol L-rhamnosyltransferase